MSQTITLRLPDTTADWLKSAARRNGRSINELGTVLFEEARRVSEFADIEFRAFGGERHACLKGDLQIWQVIAVAQDYGLDAEKTAAHFGFPVWRVQAALNYYEAFPEEIDSAIEENRAMDYEKLKRLFPQMKLVETPKGASRTEQAETR
ncbi:MAG: transcriptional regulator [Armatimonadetes bacterium]|nr:transcriptional regulator [Armatimonadota bacterium]